MIKRINLLCALNLLIFALLICLTGCSGGAYKSSGQYKRDVLTKRIEKARQSHERARSQFQVVLTGYSSIVDSNETDLRDEYNKLVKQYNLAKAVANDMYRKNDEVEKFGKPLFRDWEDELDAYKNEAIRRSSEEYLDTTRRNYLQVLHAIKNSRSSTASILKTLDDQMLFLSQNLNSDALKSFKKEIEALKTGLIALDKMMEKAIDETKKFATTGSKIAATVQK